MAKPELDYLDRPLGLYTQLRISKAEDAAHHQTTIWFDAKHLPAPGTPFAFRDARRNNRYVDWSYLPQPIRLHKRTKPPGIATEVLQEI